MPKMLLVHPYYGLMKLWIQLLREKGFEVVFADNLADTLKRLKAEKFDLLVIEPLLGPGQEGFPLDEKFSNYPGLEAMRQIRANAFASAGNPKSLPIIVWTMMSAGSGEGYALALSFKPERIIDAIRSVGSLAQVCHDLLNKK